MVNVNFPWLDCGRKLIGTHEIAGPKDNPTVVDLWKEGDVALKVDDDETPWCAAFVSAMLEEAKIKSARTGWARGYLKWGKKLKGPAVGCVVVFSRGATSGHVGFVTGKDAHGNLMVMGGNQADSIKVEAFNTAHVLGYRWSSDVPMPAKTGFDTLPVVNTHGIAV